MTRMKPTPLIAENPVTLETTKPEPVLQVTDLVVQTETGHKIIHDLAFSVNRGEIVGVAGESGSGKTTMALALLGYATQTTRISGGSIRIGDSELDLTDERKARQLRGRLISQIPQDPASALNPSIRVGKAVAEMAAFHHHDSDVVTISSLFESAGLPTAKSFMQRFPHQLSGGQQQRVCIAVALSCEPPLVVLDEPTTGLDVITQDKIIRRLIALRDENDVAMVYISHDLAVVAQLADRIIVMYAGRIVEEGPTSIVLQRPRHPYTRGLLASIPDHVEPRQLHPMPGIAAGVEDQGVGCSFAPRCPMAVARCSAETPDAVEISVGWHVRCHRWSEVTEDVFAVSPPNDLRTGSDDVSLSVKGLRAEHRSRREVMVAADDISFELKKGGCVALVGESGSGKTTIARTIAGIHPIAGGSVWLGADLLPSNARKRTPDQRRRIQMVLQSPADSLNPRQSVSTAIARPAQLLRGLSRSDAHGEVVQQLSRVRLASKIGSRYPFELSGGERQRVSIARALAANPEIIICDEITSALDVSVQAAILDLLLNLRAELSLSLLFVTHDLGVVTTIADEVLVLNRGRICETGPVSKVLKDPEAEYTKQLLRAAPSISTAIYRNDAERDLQPG
jgi:peptide/nickel transport system ATP-binding protein